MSKVFYFAAVLFDTELLDSQTAERHDVTSIS